MSSSQASSSRPRLYLDYAATTPLLPEVLQTMLPIFETQFGNPSSLHRWGREAKKALDAARLSVAESLGANSPQEIVFTSGATEADNLAIIGVAKALEAKGKHLITTNIEHPAVETACTHLEHTGWDITRLPVDENGFVSLQVLEQAVRPETVLVSIIHGNNEVGTLQNLQELGNFLRSRQILFHTDAVQTVGKVPMSLKDLPIDYLSLSGHKIYGPKGVGALYIREAVMSPQALALGGGQEQDLRSGTENLAAIIGLSKALELAVQRLQAETLRLQGLQKQLIDGIESRIPSAILNGPRDLTRRVPGNVHFSLPPVEGEAWVRHLDLQGIAVSSGSACHSAVVEPSRIVLALGKSTELARSTLRFSLGLQTTEADIDQTLKILTTLASRLIKTH
jgi:cysteine desulfurase